MAGSFGYWPGSDSVLLSFFFAKRLQVDQRTGWADCYFNSIFNKQGTKPANCWLDFGQIFHADTGSDSNHISTGIAHGFGKTWS